jgi:glycosyltransferase involved in cell wall biosynthesis
MNILDQINKEGISIVIGARNEEKTLPMTICSLMEDMYASGITKFEFILCDNGSEDETSKFFAWKPVDKTGRWQYEYSPRGIVAEDRLRIFFDPVLSNVGTRNKGVQHARYENIIFADAHTSVRQGTVKSIISNLIKFGGIVHAPISWMGSSSDNPKPGYQYSYKIGEKIWGTWQSLKPAETAFYVPICGHAFMAVRRKEFLDCGGYPQGQRVYGGGEPYLDTKYWMLGSTSMMDPEALVYHLSAGRGYAWHNNDLIFNMLLVSYILGGEKWMDRIMITYLNSQRIHKDFLKLLRYEALIDGEKDRIWLEEHKKFGFEEVLGIDKEKLLRESSDSEKLKEEDWYCKKCTKRGHAEPHVMRPWDVKNEELHGNHRSYVQEFLLRKDESGNIFIGNTPIVDIDAIELANKYL